MVEEKKKREREREFEFHSIKTTVKYKHRMQFLRRKLSILNGTKSGTEINTTIQFHP